ncbi:MAG: hypothetical protein H6657_25000 [Ardenticatenaceae bacterium]|nr:hypothetical protein [Ardenticatenaceae bacterium]
MKTFLRFLQLLVDGCKAGCILIAVIVVVSFAHPDKTIATGGCTVPDGICNTSTNL